MPGAFDAGAHPDHRPRTSATTIPPPGCWARTPARLPDHERSPVLDVDLSIRDLDGQAVVALRGELGLADAPSVASHLIAAVAACGPWVIVDLADLEGIGYSGLSVLLRVRKWTRRS